MAQRPFYLHIGLPKTATTYLQRQIFPRITGIHYLGKPKDVSFLGSKATGHGVVGRCFKQSALIWDELGDEIFQNLLPHETDGADRPVLLSEEDIATGGRKPLLPRS